MSAGIQPYTSSFTRYLVEFRDSYFEDTDTSASLGQRIVVQITRRAVSFSVSLLLHAEAVCKAVYAFFLTIGSIIFNSLKELVSQQSQESKEALGESVKSMGWAIGKKRVHFNDQPQYAPPILQQHKGTQTEEYERKSSISSFSCVGGIEDESASEIQRSSSGYSTGGSSHFSLEDDITSDSFRSLPLFPDEEFRIKKSKERLDLPEPVKIKKELGNYKIRIDSQATRSLLESNFISSNYNIPTGDKVHQMSVFAVIQPKVGMRAAAYVLENLPIELICKMKENNPNELRDEGITSAIVQTMHSLNLEFFSSHSDQKVHPELENITDHGAHITLAITLQNTLWIARIGDGNVTVKKENGQLQSNSPVKLKSFIGLQNLQEKGTSIPSITKTEICSLEGATLILTHNEGQNDSEPYISMEIQFPRSNGENTTPVNERKQSISSSGTDDSNWEKV